MQTRNHVDFTVVRSNDLHPLARPLFDEAPTFTSKSLEMEGQIPLLQLFTSGSLSYIFSARKKEVNTSKLKTRLAKTFLRPFSQTIAAKKVVISAEIWGVFIGLKRIQIWAPKFEFSLGSRCWRCHRPALGCWAVPPPDLRFTCWASNLAQTKSNFGPIWPLTRI